MKIFAAVPLELLMDTRLTARQFRLMVALLSFCHRGQMTVHPKRQTLAERARMRESQVSIETTALVRLGWPREKIVPFGYASDAVFLTQRHGTRIRYGTRFVYRLRSRRMRRHR